MDWRRSSNTTLRGWVERLSLISDTVFKTPASRARFRAETFHGFDFDSTMLRIGSMNMLLHGIENPDIRYKDSLAQSDTDDADPIVPYQHEVDLHEALKAKGGVSQLHTVAGGGHGGLSLEESRSVFAAIRGFLAEQQLLP